jgi:sphinganine C4-monooxygenase
MLQSNQTACLTKDHFTYPIYHTSRQSLIHPIPDRLLTLASPIIAYWSLSLIFHYLDTCNWKRLEKYRIHPSEEVKSRNLVSRSQVVWAVIFQQVIQTIMGLFWLSDESPGAINHALKIREIAGVLHPFVDAVLGGGERPCVVLEVASFVYWWGIPIAQFFGAMYVPSFHHLSPCSRHTHLRFIIDTWQYFLHRLMHINKFLYKQFHSWHHRLYVPYAFGSLYNHPLEGFLLDTLGAVIAEWAMGLSTRQAMLLFSVSSLKTVDDHCGYNFPWDPLQMLTGNNADYHDIHHQVSRFFFCCAWRLPSIDYLNNR